MATYITNITGIKEVLEQKARIIIKKTTDEVLERFKGYIQEHVYDGHEPNEIYYNPRGQEFKEAWDWTPIKKEVDMLVTRMWYDWSEMSNIPDFFIKGKNGGISVGIHGSKVGDWDSDERPYLAEVLNKTEPSSSLWISVGRKKAYWNEFIDDFIKGGELGRIIKKHAISEGFEIL